jgi:uncharacterized RDD family membrane protein YckC
VTQPHAAPSSGPPGAGPPGGPPPPGGYPAPPTAGYTVPPQGYGPPGYPYPPAPPRPAPVAPGGAPLAEFWERLVAYLIDSLLLGAIVMVPLLGLLAALFFTLFDINPADAAQAQPSVGRLLLFEALAFVVALLVPLVAMYVYHVPLMVRTGQTPGKRIMKIRIVNAADGGPLDRRQARLRWVVHFVAGTLAPYFSWADGLWQLWDQPYRQCLHDKCAVTVVVKVAR